MEFLNCFVNYKCFNIVTLPSLSMPPMEHVYLQRDPIYKSEVSIENGKQEVDLMRRHHSIYDIYSIQQAIYRNAAHLYRLLYCILPLFEETFNPNSYYVGDMSVSNTENHSDRYSEISNLINDLLNSSEFSANDGDMLYTHIDHIGKILEKIHSILLPIYEIKTATACHNLRNYFSIPPPNKPPKTTKYYMSDYISDNHSANRSDLLIETFTENPFTFMHLCLTSSIDIDKSPNNGEGKIIEGHIRIYFRDKDDTNNNTHIDLRVDGIGSVYYSFLSSILHDAIPIYTKPDDINKKHLACNTLCAVIAMESMVISWDNLSRCLKNYYNESMGTYTFSELIYDLYKKIPEGSPIQNNFFNLHVQLMDIIKLIDIEIEKYTQNFENYIKYLKTIPQSSYRSMIEKRMGLI